jgi:alpha-glucoside transport system substrate-binding protein
MLEPGTVSVLATWTGDEQASFEAMVHPFEERTGVRVVYEGSRDVGAVLASRVQAGYPPDLVSLPSPGEMAPYARAGELVPLSRFLDLPTLRAQYGSDWLGQGAVDGTQYAIFVKADLKSLVWYVPSNFAAKGYAVPRSWDDLTKLDARIAASGVSPWCLGLESSSISGWPGTDWVEDILLHQSGPGPYDQWAQGRLRWTSPEVRRAFQTWGAVVAGPGMVEGGAQGALLTNFADSSGLFARPPRCYMQHQGSFMTGFYLGADPTLKPGRDFSFFAFPEIDARYAGAQVVGGDLVAMFQDTPAARALMRYLTTAEAQAVWVRRGGAISPNTRVPLSDYPDALSRQLASTLTNAKIVRFGASDAMPDAMQSAFYEAVLAYANDPGRLDSILADLDRVQASAYAVEPPGPDAARSTLPNGFRE